jgi:low density lipoprotein receptor-related protein 5/6
MFWTDLGKVSKIERAGMNGDPETRKVIVHTTVFPTSLTVDFDAQLLYCLDAELKWVKVMDYEGRKRRNIIREGMEHPFRLTLFNNILYWTDRSTR